MTFLLKMNTVEVAAYPESFNVTVLDVDNGESSVRTADATLTRDRIAVKRQIEASWGLLTWSEISSLLTAMGGVFFDLYYPDPYTGQYETKTFYAGNRPALTAVAKDNEIWWKGLKVTLTEQ